MTEPLLQTLFNDPGAAQLAGGIMMIMLFSAVGVAAAGAFAYVARRMFHGRYEQFFWSLLLIGIAAFYTGFAGWFQVETAAWRTELWAIAGFALLAILGLFSARMLACGYVAHGLWDIAHSLYGTSIHGLAASDIPLGYGIFCLGFDIATAAYLLCWPKDWRQPGQFTPRFWRASMTTASANVRRNQQEG
ncbi:MAG: hypothetical protein EVA65_01130 [Oceanococcus sp.]|nr:MAG: hypothetical protein EVA65_01130 [Oceanococcus sp.]